MKYYERSEAMRKAGLEKYKTDFNAVNLMSTIHKLKACVSVLIKDDVALINEARTIYFNHNTITYDYDDDQPQRPQYPAAASERPSLPSEESPYTEYDNFMNERHNFVLENEASGPIVPTTADSVMILPRLRGDTASSRFGDNRSVYSRLTRNSARHSAAGKGQQWLSAKDRRTTEVDKKGFMKPPVSRNKTTGPT